MRRKQRGTRQHCSTPNARRLQTQLLVLLLSFPSRTLLPPGPRQTLTFASKPPPTPTPSSRIASQTSPFSIRAFETEVFRRVSHACYS